MKIKIINIINNLTLGNLIHTLCILLIIVPLYFEIWHTVLYNSIMYIINILINLVVVSILDDKNAFFGKKLNKLFYDN